MKELTRFGISMEDDLLQHFDRLIARKGYSNRSEAIRDIVRDKLVEETVDEPTACTVGALVYMYDHQKRDVEKALSDLRHEFSEHIISTSHVHADQHRSVEVVLLRGKAVTLKAVAAKLLSLKGVQYGKLTLTAALDQPQYHHAHH